MDRAASIDRERASAGTDAEKVAASARSRRAVAWDVTEAVAVRLTALTSLLNDSDPVVAVEAKELARQLLPREDRREIVAYLSRAAADRGWTDFTPSLVRSLSRWLPGVDDRDRQEKLALERLNPGKSIEQIVFDVFLDPPPLEMSYGVDWRQRARADAWDLLSRLDTTGAERANLLTSEDIPTHDPLLVAMKRSLRDLRTAPKTGAELTWLASLSDERKKANAAWWEETAAAMRSLPDRGALELRHAEAIRWSVRHRPEWATAAKDELLTLIDRRLAGRRVRARDWDNGPAAYRESFREARSKLSWGDAVIVLVIDEAIRSPGVLASLSKQVEMDRADKTTEYGGLLIDISVRESEASDGTGSDGAIQSAFAAVLYPPRPGERRGDTRFVASDDMIAASDRALAHYHFHAQRVFNSAYAGPSGEDLRYAARYGRSCVVLTSVAEGVLNVDYYQPDGTVLDLGDIQVKPAE